MTSHARNAELYVVGVHRDARRGMGYGRLESHLVAYGPEISSATARVCSSDQLTEDHCHGLVLEKKGGLVSWTCHIKNALKKEKIVNSLPPLRRPFWGAPFSAAILRALVTASARLTKPEWTGLTLLISILPELLGFGSAYWVAPRGTPIGGPAGGYG